MHFSSTLPLLLAAAAGTARLSLAHTVMTNFAINGKDNPVGFAVRYNRDTSTENYPVEKLASADMACGHDGQTGAQGVVTASAGDTITFTYHKTVGATGPMMDASHKGPCAVYMKKVDNAAASGNAAGDGWFKIFQDDVDTPEWCTTRMINGPGQLSAKIPTTVPKGNYLIRSELLALHNAMAKDPQFYIGCAQVSITSGGSGSPGPTCAIPGYVNMGMGDMTFDIYTSPVKPYPAFGPSVFGPNDGGPGGASGIATGSSGGSSSSSTGAGVQVASNSKSFLEKDGATNTGGEDEDDSDECEAEDL